MTWLSEMFSPGVSMLVLRLRVVDSDGAILYQHLDEEIPQRSVLCPRGVGVISGTMVRRRFVDEYGSTVEPALEPYLLHHTIPEDGVFYH